MNTVIILIVMFLVMLLHIGYTTLTVSDLWSSSIRVIHHQQRDLYDRRVDQISQFIDLRYINSFSSFKFF